MHKMVGFFRYNRSQYHKLFKIVDLFFFRTILTNLELYWQIHSNKSIFLSSMTHQLGTIYMPMKTGTHLKHQLNHGVSLPHVSRNHRFFFCIFHKGPCRAPFGIPCDLHEVRTTRMWSYWRVSFQCISMTDYTTPNSRLPIAPPSLALQNPSLWKMKVTSPAA